jgi:hypothetical protein
MFALGKTFKYTIWASIALFWYHVYLLKKTEKPETGFLANDFFLEFARKADFAYHDLIVLLTRPPIEKLLPDRFPGQPAPKTIVLNLRGTLISQEYKVYLTAN